MTLHIDDDVDAAITHGIFVAGTGVSGSGKSTLVSRVLRDVVREHLRSGRGDGIDDPDDDDATTTGPAGDDGGLTEATVPDARADTLTVRRATGLEHIDR